MFTMGSVFVAIVLILMAMSAMGDQTSYMIRTGKKYLEEQSAREGVYTLKSGLRVEILKESTNPEARSPNVGDSCECTYEGWLKDGTRFDGGTTSFAPNQVIKGWTEAMQLMSEGDKWKLHIPYDKAYGERGSPPRIPPYSVLVFEIEIHKVKSSPGSGKTVGKAQDEARAAFQKALAVPEGEL
jgi:FKBP-type peptidyl-prolyl cis-trans isomerase FklB